MALPHSPRYTVQEYLAMERESDERHEYLDGHIYAMAGESLQHSQICVNLIGEIRSQLKARDCQVLSPNMKVRSGNSGLFSYPDLTVVCGKPLFLDGKKDVLLNPTVIVEVLSPSTEAFDRGEKFIRYQSFLDSLMEYLLVSQHRPLIMRFARQDKGQWLSSFAEGLSSKLAIDAIDCQLDLSEIYSRVTFPEITEPDPDQR